jgi:hypothetical protein
MKNKRTIFPIFGIIGVRGEQYLLGIYSVTTVLDKSVKSVRLVGHI